MRWMHTSELGQPSLDSNASALRYDSYLNASITYHALQLGDDRDRRESED